MKKFLNIFKYLGKYQYIYYGATLAAGILRTVIDLIYAYANKMIFNSLEYNDPNLLKKGYLLCGLLILAVCVYPFTRLIALRVVRKIVYNIKVNMFDIVSSRELSFFDTSHSGDMVQKISNDAESLKTLYFTQVFVIFTLCINAIAGIINMFIYNSLLAVISLFFGGISVIASITINKKIKIISKVIQEENSSMTKQIKDILTGIDIVRIYRGANIVREKFEQKNHENCDKCKKRNIILSKIDSFSYLINLVGNMGTFICGVCLVKYGIIDYGIVMAVISLQVSVSNHFNDFGGMIARLTVSITRTDRVFEVLNSKRRKEEYKKVEINNNDDIYVKNLTFSYNSKEKVFDNLNVVIKGGKKNVIIGPSGVGKTTFFKILLGLYEVESGKVYVNSKEVDINEPSWRNNFTYVEQRPFLFKESLLYNLKIGKRDASFDEVVDACKLANIHEWILNLDNGYNTFVDDNGKNFSGGQIQRIAIARAFLKDAPIILLDEPTSALDEKNKFAIEDALMRLIEKRTVIIITHNMDLIEQNDNIVRL